MSRQLARSLVAIACVFELLASNAFGRTPSQEVSKWPVGKRIEVTFTSGEKVIGRLGPVTPESFTLNPDKKSAGGSREVRYSDVRSVKSKWTTGEKWLMGGLIYAGMTVFFAALLGT